jgi:hypothetical protein
MIALFWPVPDDSRTPPFAGYVLVFFFLLKRPFFFQKSKVDVEVGVVETRPRLDI